VVILFDFGLAWIYNRNGFRNGTDEEVWRWCVLSLVRLVAWEVHGKEEYMYLASLETQSLDQARKRSESPFIVSSAAASFSEGPSSRTRPSIAYPMAKPKLQRRGDR